MHRAAVDLEAGPELGGSGEALQVGESGSLPLPLEGALRVLKNFLSQAGSNLAAQAFAFFSTAYVARCLRAEGFGWIGFAQGLLAYFTLMTDLGLRTVGMREVAKHHEDVPTWVGHILGLRLALAGISMTVFLAVVVLIPRSAAFKWFLVEYGFMIFTSALLLDWAFQGLERMELVALGETLRAAGFLALVLIGLHHRSQILRVPLFTVLSQFVPVALLLGLFWRQFHQIRPTVNLEVWKDLLRQSLPISLSSFALQLGAGMGVVVLGLLKSAAEVGYYSAAYRLALLPANFTTVMGFAVFPLMARYSREAPEKLKVVNRYLQRFLTLLAVPMVIGGWVVAPAILPMVFGHRFEGAILPFRILLCYLLLAHTWTSLYYLMLACGKHEAYAKTLMAGAVAGAAANLLLIPFYGAAGAACAMLLSHAAMLWFSNYYVSREVTPVRTFAELLRAVPLAALMALTMFLTPGAWLVKLAIGLAVYAFALAIWERHAWVPRLFRQSEIRLAPVSDE